MLFFKADLQARLLGDSDRSSDCARCAGALLTLSARCEQEASTAKVAAEGGLAGHRALKAARKAQRTAAADEKKKKHEERRRRLRDCIEAMHGSARPARAARCARWRTPLRIAATH